MNTKDVTIWFCVLFIPQVEDICVALADPLFGQQMLDCLDIETVTVEKRQTKF